VQSSWTSLPARLLSASLACVPTWHEDFRKDLTRVDIPTLVIHGDADRIVPISAAGSRTAKLIKGARLAVVKDGPHCVTWTHAEEVNPRVGRIPWGRNREAYNFGARITASCTLSDRLLRLAFDGSICGCRGGRRMIQCPLLA